MSQHLSSCLENTQPPLQLLEPRLLGGEAAFGGVVFGGAAGPGLFTAVYPSVDLEVGTLGEGFLAHFALVDSLTCNIMLLGKGYS